MGQKTNRTRGTCNASHALNPGTRHFGQPSAAHISDPELLQNSTSVPLAESNPVSTTNVQRNKNTYDVSNHFQKTTQAC